MHESLLLLFCKTDISEEMRKRLCEVICVAPWTSLDLSGETAMSDERIVKKGVEGTAFMCKQRGG